MDLAVVDSIHLEVGKVGHIACQAGRMVVDMVLAGKALVDMDLADIVVVRMDLADHIELAEEDHTGLVDNDLEQASRIHVELALVSLDMSASLLDQRESMLVLVIEDDLSLDVLVVLRVVRYICLCLP